MSNSIEQKSINTLRLLCADMVQKANSGHPGLPLGAAPMMFELWSKHLKHHPQNPNWQDRDRFVLSAGHGSALLYATLHSFGYDISLEDLKSFRQFGSLTPGHPEYLHTAGVEVTTGPLGQGFANAVGMAMAEKHLAAKFNREGFEVVDHHTYLLCGDGCLMEGISSEAASLAGTLGLNKLIALYDSNNITIEGSTDLAFKENVALRFEAYGWQVIKVEDGNDLVAISAAIEKAKQETQRPTFIEVATQIGFGSPNKAGKASAHGEPLGVEEIKLLKGVFGVDPQKEFDIPQDVKTFIAQKAKEGEQKEKNWNNLLLKYKEKYPQEWAELDSWLGDKLDLSFLDSQDFWSKTADIATRVSSEISLNKVAKNLPNLFGGSADLAPSTKSIMAGKGDFSKENPAGANIHFGVREHAMSAIANGIALHGGLKVYVAGFFVFADYMKNPIRLSAMMKLPIINIFTHDSIGVGEDGPTHQPIEQLAMLRSIPGFTVFRPCDSVETAAGWKIALTRKSPTALILTRQNLKQLEGSGAMALKGGYIVAESAKSSPDAIIIATGSEVALACDAKKALLEQNIDVRVVSMPSMEIFEEQTAEYREGVLPSDVTARVSVEAGSSFGWHKYVGLKGGTVSIDEFGMSAPSDGLFKHFGFTVANVVEKVLAQINIANIK